MTAGAISSVCEKPQDEFESTYEQALTRSIQLNNTTGKRKKASSAVHTALTYGDRIMVSVS